MTNRERFEQAFTEWERRWREEPDRFMSEMTRLAETVESIGAQQAAYFELLLEECAEAKQ